MVGDITSTVSHYTFPALLLHIVMGGVFLKYHTSWTWVQSMYVCVQTITSVGYGDFTPSTTGQKCYLIFFIMFGMLLLAMIVGPSLAGGGNRSSSRLRAPRPRCITDRRGCCRFGLGQLALLFASDGKVSSEEGNVSLNTSWKYINKGLVALFMISILVCILAAFMICYEDWTVVDGFYFSVVSVASIG